MAKQSMVSDPAMALLKEENEIFKIRWRARKDREWQEKMFMVLKGFLEMVNREENDSGADSTLCTKTNAQGMRSCGYHFLIKNMQQYLICRNLTDY